MRPKVETEKKARTKGVSLKPEAYQRVLERVEQLSPFVPSFSAYFQLLADIDERDHLIEKELMRKLEENNKNGRPEGAPIVKKLRGSVPN